MLFYGWIVLKITENNLIFFSKTIDFLLLLCYTIIVLLINVSEVILGDKFAQETVLLINVLQSVGDFANRSRRDGVN